MNESCQMWMNHVTHQCIVSYICMSNIVCESYQIRMSCMNPTYESCPIWIPYMSHVTYVYHIWIPPCTSQQRVAPSCHTYECETRIEWTRRIHMCDMTYSYVWHDVFICVTWRIHMCDMTYSYVWHDVKTRNENWVKEICHLWAHCNTQHDASHLYGTRVEWMRHCTCEHAATHWNKQKHAATHTTLQHTPRCITSIWNEGGGNESCHTWAHCNTLQHTTHCIQSVRNTSRATASHNIEGHVYFAAKPASFRNKSCLTREWVISHTWMDHDTQTKCTYFAHTSVCLPHDIYIDSVDTSHTLGIQCTYFAFTSYVGQAACPTISKGMSNALQHAAKRCNTLQHTATRCNILTCTDVTHMNESCHSYRV